MIVIEISDESILFLLRFIVFSIIIGWFIVQWDLNRMTRRIKRIKKEREQ